VRRPWHCCLLRWASLSSKPRPHTVSGKDGLGTKMLQDQAKEMSAHIVFSQLCVMPHQQASLQGSQVTVTSTNSAAKVPNDAAAVCHPSSWLTLAPHQLHQFFNTPLLCAV